MALILVVDDHGVYRAGLRSVIEAALQQASVLEAKDLSVMRECIEAKRSPDLVLIDSKIINHQPLGLVREIHQTSPGTRFAMMSTSNVRADVLFCLSVGFHGFLNKSQPAEEVLSAIIDLLSGRIYVPPWLADGDDNGHDAEGCSRITHHADISRLTPRQNEVLTLLAQGLSNKEIAQRLRISEGTAKIHTAGLLRTIGARNRTEAAFKAANMFEAGQQSDGEHRTVVPLPRRVSGTRV